MLHVVRAPLAVVLVLGNVKDGARIVAAKNEAATRVSAAHTTLAKAQNEVVSMQGDVRCRDYCTGIPRLCSSPVL